MRKKDLKYKKLEYVLSVPDTFDDQKKYPLIVFFHGSGGRGTDIKMLHENPYFTQTDPFETEAVSVAPQCYADSWFDIFEQLQDFIKHMTEQDFIDRERVYLIGHSMGGYAVWQMAMAIPELLAAIVPICGGGMYWNGGRLKNLKIRAFHGSEDDCVFPEESVKMVNAVNAAGGDARLVMCEGVGHDSWMNAYRDKELFLWMLAQKNTGKASKREGFDNQEMFG